MYAGDITPSVALALLEMQESLERSETSMGVPRAQQDWRHWRKLSGGGLAGDEWHDARAGASPVPVATGTVSA
jgi:hypothetical protein